MRRRLAAAAVAAALPCASLVAAAPAAQADGCGAYAWAEVGYTYGDGPRPEGVPWHDATQGESLPVTGPGCQDFANPMEVRLETLQDATVQHTARVTLDSSLADAGCVADVNGQPLAFFNDEGVPTTGEVPVDVSGYAAGFNPVPVTVDCGAAGSFTIPLGMTVIASADQTQLSLEDPAAKAASSRVTGRLVSRRTHRGIRGAYLRIYSHGLRVGWTTTGRHGGWTWTRPAGIRPGGLQARYHATVRHLHSRSH